MARIGDRFVRRESLVRACDLVEGLMSDLECKNVWTIAEHVSDDNPYGMQNLLLRGTWDHDGVREDLRDGLVEHLGDPAVRCRWLTRPATSTRARPRSACNANTPALRAV